MTAEPTALELAQAELSEAMTPWPDEFMYDYSPQAGLLFARQVSMCLLKMVTDAAASLGADGEDSAATLHEVLNGVAAMVAGSTHALVTLEVLPPEAEEAITSGEPA